MGKKTYIIIFVIIIFIILIVPFKITMVEERTLTIVDADGNPMIAAKVRNIWNNYSLNIRGGIDYNTDDKGQVSIKTQSVKSNIISIIFGSIKELSKTGIHTSFGSSESIGILTVGYEDIWFHDGEGLTSNVIIVKKKK